MKYFSIDANLMSVTAMGNLKLLYYFGRELEYGIDQYLYHSDLLSLTRNSATLSAVDWYMVYGYEGSAPALKKMEEHKKSPNSCLVF